MWSHYSNNHTGFVVGFRTDSLLDDYNFDYIEPIVYQKTYPVISGLDEITERFHKKFFYKSDLWAYENEWRISKNHIKDRTIKLKRETINQIIIGCCAGFTQSKSLIKLCKKTFGNNFPIYQAYKNENEFGIAIKQIE
jgi:hypothetical protein